MSISDAQHDCLTLGDVMMKELSDNLLADGRAVSGLKRDDNILLY